MSSSTSSNPGRFRSRAWPISIINWFSRPSLTRPTSRSALIDSSVSSSALPRRSAFFLASVGSSTACSASSASIPEVAAIGLAAAARCALAPPSTKHPPCPERLPTLRLLTEFYRAVFSTRKARDSHGVDRLARQNLPSSVNNILTTRQMLLFRSSPARPTAAKSIA